MAPSGRTALLCLALAACRTAPPPRPADPSAAGAERFPGAAAILAGFDAAEPDTDWRAGDRVLFALSTESAGRVRAKLIELELLGFKELESWSGPVKLRESMRLRATVGGQHAEWSSMLLRVAVRVYEADGKLVQRTEAVVPETVLRSGMHPALEFYFALASRPEDARTELTDAERRTLGEGLAMLPTLLRILQDDGVLQPLLMQVVGPPPLLSLLTGVHVLVSCDFEQAGPVACPAAIPCASGPVHRLPLQLLVNDDPALDLALVVAAADPPLRLSGGILSLGGVSCGGSGRRVTLELLAARRGPAGAELR